ncbi:hypothetical protein AYO21_09260 [Fonsecaea monophora]|uniref:Uncharacterized protein n=1 Tax=Fonsecaea monophora TaxID=254056 RepID=A0A177EZZ4_9EURO|nr:hypothetical protein AYO21_09260 [Fonsecaea monophora]OAG36529.1 hypothetical protein AYO21_09260 [Fonsecaea monophora]
MGYVEYYGIVETTPRSSATLQYKPHGIDWLPDNRDGDWNPARSEHGDAAVEGNTTSLKLGFTTNGARFEDSKTTLIHFIRDVQLKKMEDAATPAGSAVEATFEDHKTTLIHFIRDARLKKMEDGAPPTGSAGSHGPPGAGNAQRVAS